MKIWEEKNHWLFLYSIVSQDVTFYGGGRKSAWETWKWFNDVTEAFTYMVFHPFASVDCPQFKLLECLLYDKTSELQLVNELKTETLMSERELKPWRDFLQHIAMHKTR